jgi:sialate O-acetylesterase
MRSRSCLSVLAAVALAAPAAADVTPNPLFTDGAVLQRGKPVPVFGSAPPGEEVTVSFAGQKVTATTDPNGRWLARLQPLEATDKPTDLVIAGKNTVTVKNVLVGEVWVCSGQSNMEWPLSASFEPQKDIASSANPLIRLFNVPKLSVSSPRREAAAKWMPCNPSTVPGFTAVGYYFGRDLQKALKVPVGLIETAWGGTICEAWTSPEALRAEPELKSLADKIPPSPPGGYAKVADKYLADLEKYIATAREALAAGKLLPTPPAAPLDTLPNPNIPTALYNGMIAPLVPYAINGAIWYQGESNAGRAYQYRTLMPTMIKDWRARFESGDFPFLIVQLAPFMAIEKEPKESAWAELREAQLATTFRLPKVGMAVITDVGDEKDIHPRKKEPVGARLALAARALGYGESIEYSGPVYEKMAIDGKKAVLFFKHVGQGLMVKGDKLTGFAVCGADKKFVNADAVIEGDTVVVTSPSVEKPLAVRFGWANFPVVNLWNKDGLPASPFRTDEFPGVTANAK